MTADGNPQRLPANSAQESYFAAERALAHAESVLIETAARLERRVGQLRENERIAYRKLYESVSCAYCLAPAGTACSGVDWPMKHTARAADCLRPRVLA